MSNQNSVELENIKTVNSIAMGFNEKFLMATKMVTMVMLMRYQ